MLEFGPERRTVWDLIEQRADLTPDRLWAMDERGRRVTFRELLQWSEGVAAGLSERGVVANAVIAWQIPTWIEALILSSALSRLDVIQVPLLPIYRERELSHILKSTRANWYIAPQEWKGTDFAQLLGRAVGVNSVIRQLWLNSERALPLGDPSTLTPGMV